MSVDVIEVVVEVTYISLVLVLLKPDEGRGTQKGARPTEIKTSNFCNFNILEAHDLLIEDPVWSTELVLGFLHVFLHRLSDCVSFISSAPVPPDLWGH